MSSTHSMNVASFSRLFMHERVLLVAVLFLVAFAAFAFGAGPEPFHSSELRFTELSAGGLSIMPASCPSSPHYSGQCSGIDPVQPSYGCVLYADPTETTAGGAVGLSWAVATCPLAFASYGPSWCSQAFGISAGISPGVGGVNAFPAGMAAKSGGTSYVTVYPAETTTYTMTVSYYASDYWFQEGYKGSLQEMWQCSRTVNVDGEPPPTCTPTYFCSGNDLYYRNASCAETISQTCSYGCSNGACVNSAAPSATLTVTPLLVHSGNTTAVSWTSQNVSSCTVRGTNGDGAGASPWNGTSGTKTSSAINAQVTYTMTCTGNDSSTITQSATVNILPVFCETGIPGC